MRAFEYGPNDAKNKPVALRNVNQFNVSGTASQRHCLIRMLPFIIGSKVPKDNETWRLLLLCREIMDTCLAPRVRAIDLFRLENAISEHNMLYSKLASTFPPKFHFLLHYPRLIRNFGPLRNFWCIRYVSNYNCILRLLSYSCGVVEFNKLRSL